MPTPLRVAVVTGSNLESGTVLGYLLDTTALRISTIYLDTGTPSPRTPSPSPPRWFRDPATFRHHLGLCRALPRSYGFRVLQRLTGVSELQALAWLERLSPSLLSRVVGVEPPPDARRPLLRRLADVAAAHAIPLVRTPSLNSDATVQALQAEAPDVVLGLGTRILSARLLATARLGFLNAHSSLLPDFRGGVTEFWQLVHGEQQTGVSIHWMAAKVDEGPLCAQKSWPIPPGADHHRLRLLSFFGRLELWREVLERLLAGEIPAEPQRPARTPTFRAPTVRQMYEFYCQGRRPSIPSSPSGDTSPAEDVRRVTPGLAPGEKVPASGGLNMHFPRFLRSPLARLLRSLPVRGRWRVAPWLNRRFPLGTVSVELPHLGQVRLDLEDEDQLQIYWTGLHPDDRRMIRLVRAVLPGDGIFVDVGANLGIHTLAAAHHLAAGGGAVLAFEPHPANFATLRHNLETNGLRHVTTEQLGLAEAAATLSCRGPGRGGNWSLDSRGETTFIVRLTRLDDYLDEHPLPRLDVMKIDVEGAEVRVLRGAARTIDRFRPVILFEVCPSWLGRLQATTEELLAGIESHGYQVHALDDRALLGRRVGVADLAWMGPSDWTNLVAVPAEFAASATPQFTASQERRVGGPDALLDTKTART